MPRRRRERRRAVTRGIAPRELRERYVEVGLGERRERRQDDVRVARGLVEVDIEAHHQRERFECLRDPRTVRCREYGVTRDGEHRAHLARARGLDLLGEASDRQLAEHLRRARHTATPPARGHALPLARRARGVRRERRRFREHRAARLVEVPGQRVDHVDEPRRERAVLLRARADAAVEGRALAGSELVRELADGRRIDPAARRREIRREVRHRRAHLVDADHVLREAPELDQPVGEQGVHDREQEKYIPARPDRHVAIGELRGLGGPRIDHDQLPAARLHRLRLAAKVGHRPHAAVGRDRVRPEDHEQVRAIEVGHRHAQPVAEHPSRRELLRHLVEGRRGEHVRRADRPRQPRAVQQEARLVRRRVAEHHRDRIRPVLGEDRRQSPLDLRERLVPRDLDERTTLLHERRAQPIGIRVQLADRRTLRADEPRARDVLVVPADRRDAISIEGELEAAAGLAQGTDAMRDHQLSSGSSMSSRSPASISLRVSPRPGSTFFA